MNTNNIPLLLFSGTNRRYVDLVIDKKQRIYSNLNQNPIYLTHSLNTALYYAYIRAKEFSSSSTLLIVKNEFDGLIKTNFYYNTFSIPFGSSKIIDIEINEIIPAMKYRLLGKSFNDICSNIELLNMEPKKALGNEYEKFL